MGGLFGTDGIRGVANISLTADIALGIGYAAAEAVYEKIKRKPVFLVACDTRRSSGMLSASLSAGLCSAGADVITLGCLPTPAAAYLTLKYGADGAAVVSASHNPPEYNGIKFLSRDGGKLSCRLEERIERIFTGNAPAKTQNVGRIRPAASPRKDYTDFIAACAECDLSGLRIALDCANGAASYTAKRIFTRLGADVTVINVKKDGTDINVNCGATDTRRLSAFVRGGGYDCGAAFDGDADRCICIDENGDVFDGDMMLSAFASDMKAEGRLLNNGVVGTVMSNFGLRKFCAENGIKFAAADVGDRYVAEEAEKGGYILGGEQSGHIIFRGLLPTGDGQLTAVKTFCLMKKYEKKLSRLSKMKKYPQITKNVPVSEEKKTRIVSDPALAEAVKLAEAELGGDGRALVRPSGTEPFIRVTAEGADLKKTESVVDRLCEIIKETE